ncbi:MAG: response regulator [Hespellia sp.]|nr:response regulator [Hespellia sp.]
MPQKITVLFIEDEKNILAFVSKILKTQNYKVLTAETGKKGLHLINSICPDVILLDLGLPDMDGQTIIQNVRKWTSCPIIVISARSNESEKVKALDLGADDYITKPFGTSELLARIRTSIRHSNKLNSSSTLYIRPYQCQDLLLDFEKRQLTKRGELVHLTPIEYKIVAFLAQNSGKVMTYSSIMENVWGPYSDNDNKILRVNMANIRRKAETNPAQPQYFFTEVGVGYRMREDDGDSPLD